MRTALPIAMLGFVLLAHPAGAGIAYPLLETADGEDRAALEALARYPEDDRLAVLEVSVHPQVLLEVTALQARTRAAFEKLIAREPEETQAAIWEVVRYPELVAELVESAPASRRAIEAIADRYPEEIREAIAEVGARRRALLGRIHALNRSADGLFEALIAELSPERRAAFRHLLGRPELLSLLGERMSLAVLLGDAYERDPEGVVARLAELGDEVAAREARAQRAWARSLEEDPEACDELERSLEEYAAETGWDAADALARSTRVDMHVHLHPYPYWFGYPSWFAPHFAYADPWVYWYPRRHWVHLGFWFGPRYPLFAAGVPSLHFVDWYFREPLRHRHFPHLSRHLLRHRERHRHPHRGGLRALVGDGHRRAEPHRVRRASHHPRPGEGRWSRHRGEDRWRDRAGRPERKARRHPRARTEEHRKVHEKERQESHRAERRDVRKTERRKPRRAERRKADRHEREASRPHRPRAEPRETRKLEPREVHKAERRGSHRAEHRETRKLEHRGDKAQRRDPGASRAHRAGVERHQAGVGRSPVRKQHARFHGGSGRSRW